MCEVVEQHGPFADADAFGETDAGRLVAFEQSGKLLVPKRRAKSWYMNAASFEVRPEV
jgi:hypothetical protein